MGASRKTENAFIYSRIQVGNNFTYKSVGKEGE